MEELLARIPAAISAEMWSGYASARGSAKEFSRSLNGVGVSLPVLTTETQAETDLLQALPDVSSLECLMESGSIRPMGPATLAGLGMGPCVAGEGGRENASDCKVLTACGPLPSRQPESLSNRNMLAMDCKRILSGASSEADSDAETLGTVSMPQLLLMDISCESAEQETSDLFKLLESAGQDGTIVNSAVDASVSVQQTTPSCRMQLPFGRSIRVRGVQSTTDQRAGVCCDESAESEVCHISSQLHGERHCTLSSTGSICTTTCTAFSRRRKSVAESTADISHSDLRPIFEDSEDRILEQVVVRMPSHNRFKTFKAS